jgi:AraC family transcriptional regulator of adaptative response / DNA-3-methyladenine glycosylase II
LTDTEEFLAARAVPGVEDASAGVYRRTVRLEHGPAVIELGRVVVADPRDRGAAELAVRRLAGADPAAADAHLSRDPILGPLVTGRSGLRMPGTVDGGELAVRAVLGQQVSLAAGLRLAPDADPAEARAALLELPGIGPWTAEYVAMRALGDPDAWLPTDLGVRRSLARLGTPPEAAEAWRPHRAHAVRHLWASAPAPRGRARPGSRRAPAG